MSDGFARHVVRTALADLTPSPTSIELARRTVPAELKDVPETAGLSVKAVVIILGALVSLWLLFVAVGILCKYANKPRSAAHIGGYLSKERLYQPSAAGYGNRGSSAAPSEPKPYSSRQSLLGGASPMARVPSNPDGSFTIDYGNGSTPDLHSVSSRQQYFDAPNAGRSPAAHHRHASSGVGLPGPATAAFRRGPGGQHPPLSPAPGPSFSDALPSPDGGGFRPGQIFQHPAGSYSTPAAGPSRSGGGGGGKPVGVERSNSKVMRGPPPARNNSKRRSRYSRSPRVESLGPGQIRASKYMDDASWEDEGPEVTNYSRRKSRYSMAGGGQSRRSQYGGGGGGAQMVPSSSTRQSIYGQESEDIMRRAAAEGFGSLSPDAGPVVSRGQQQQGMDPLGAQRRSPAGTGSSMDGGQRRPMQQQQQPYPQQQQRPPQQQRYPPGGGGYAKPPNGGGPGVGAGGGYRGPRPGEYAPNGGAAGYAAGGYGGQMAPSRQAQPVGGSRQLV